MKLARFNKSANRGEDARAALPHQQMKSGAPRYPVDRYLVESSNSIEMVNIADDVTWKTEPAIQPEDEALLRRLREMLQSTADELKLISGELKREPRARFGATPAPLDDEFNERVHVEEIVDAKFHGCRILRPSHTVTKDIREVNMKPTKLTSKTANASVQVNQTPKKATKSLSMSRTRIVQIDEPRGESKKDNPRKPFVAYNEYSYKHEETQVKDVQSKPLNVQAMPSINIRGELIEQKVLQLDIVPEQKTDTEKLPTQSNVAVIAVQHESTPAIEKTISKYPEIRYVPNASPKPAFRRVSKMLTCDSSESTDNVTSKTKVKSRNQIKTPVKSIPKASARFEKYKESNNRSQLKKQNSNIDDWRRKINTIYGRPSTSRNVYARLQPASRVSTKSGPVPSSSRNKSQTLLNNAEYIPYSKLTLGGVNVSDIEREISDLTDKNVPLSPILGKILISRENSFHDSAAKKDNANKDILTTSDENLLEEVLDIERNITTTLNKNLNGKDKVISDVSSESNQSGRSYADDFEEERSDNDKTQSDDAQSNRNVKTKDDNVIAQIESGIKDATYTKSPNLSFKNRVDIFEFIHSIDTQDNATQSNGCGKITPKSTQTSPRNVRPIRNDLWLEAHGSTNPTSDVDKINEEFIKKLIVDECTDILQKNIAKTARETIDKRNSTASQKNTQTSPAHARGVMTSPTKTKTRTTSPLGPLTVDHQTSPVVFAPIEETHIALDKVDDLAASINLSSPRFSLRLPKNSRDVISNLDAASSRDRKPFRTSLPLKMFTSSSSAEADYSSDVSSFGEINDRLRRRPRRNKILTVSESSSSTSKCSSDSSVVLPLRSEGEISLGQVDRKTRFSRSEGEMSLGLR